MAANEANVEGKEKRSKRQTGSSDITYQPIYLLIHHEVTTNLFVAMSTQSINAFDFTTVYKLLQHLPRPHEQPSKV